MNRANEIMTLQLGCEEAIRQVTEQLSAHNLQVIQSFDLRQAGAMQTDCGCPHHGTSLCDCQMIVLLIYHQDESPATLVAHSSNGLTHLSLVEPEPGLSALIFTSLLYGKKTTPYETRILPKPHTSDPGR